MHYIQLEVRQCTPGEVYAVRKLSGWTFKGPLDTIGPLENITPSVVLGQATLEAQLALRRSIQTTDSLISGVNEISVVDNNVL